jgi:hypothetical protein
MMPYNTARKNNIRSIRIQKYAPRPVQLSVVEGVGEAAKPGRRIEYCIGLPFSLIGKEEVKLQVG